MTIEFVDGLDDLRPNVEEEGVDYLIYEVRQEKVERLA